jgi:fructokinase
VRAEQIDALPPRPLKSNSYFAGVIVGGTKVICAIAKGPNDIVSQTRISTTLPKETIKKVVEYINQSNIDYGISGIGITSFGPLNIDPESDRYGYIGGTPKPHWSNVDLLGPFKKFKVPIAIDHDISAAAFSEYYWNPENWKLDPLVFCNIGTGIDTGIIINGKILHGLLFSEGGHSFIPHDIQIDPFPGACPFHGDCFEGLASGSAIEKRFGMRAESIQDNDPFWVIEANYIAFALSNMILNISPKRIILGGGVMSREFLFPLIRQKILQRLNDYLVAPEILEKIDGYLVPSFFGETSGILGAIALAKNAAAQ